MVTAASCWVSTSPTFSLRRAPLCAVRLCYLTCFQSDLTVDQAVSLWPRVAAKARACGSPAMASNYTWLQDFLKSAQVSPSRCWRLPLNLQSHPCTQPPPIAVAVHHYGIDAPHLQHVLLQVLRFRLAQQCV